MSCHCIIIISRNLIHQPSERNLFRFNYNLESNFFYINLLEPVCKNWELKNYYDIL